MTAPMEKDATPRDRLRRHVMESVAKSGSGAVLVSAGEVAALFADYEALHARVEELDGKLQSVSEDREWRRDQMLAVFRGVQRMSPWATSNDMEWSDEVLTGVGLLLERELEADLKVYAEHEARKAAEARIASLEAWIGRLVNDLHLIDSQGETPDGDSVTVNVQLWAETWIGRFRGLLRGEGGGDH